MFNFVKRKRKKNKRLPLFLETLPRREYLAINVNASFTMTLDARRRFRNGAADILQPMLIALRCALTELFAVRRCKHVQLPIGELCHLYNTVTVRFARNRCGLLIQPERTDHPRKLTVVVAVT